MGLRWLPAATKKELGRSHLFRRLLSPSRSPLDKGSTPFSDVSGCNFGRFNLGWKFTERNSELYTSGECPACNHGAPCQALSQVTNNPRGYPFSRQRGPFKKSPLHFWGESGVLVHRGTTPGVLDPSCPPYNTEQETSVKQAKSRLRAHSAAFHASALRWEGTFRTVS